MATLLSLVNRHLLQRALPHGLISWRYLLPGQPLPVRIHRQLWLMGRHPGLPLPLYLLLELLLWLRWVTFSCWRQSWRLVRRRGAALHEQTGIKPAVLLWRLLVHGLGHCMPPDEVCAFALHLPERAPTAWQHIFKQESVAFHRWRSIGLPDTALAMTLVQDKYRLAELLAGHGIPTPPMLLLTTAGQPFDPMPLLQTHQRLICKPRHGSACRDTFIIEADGNRQQTIFAVNSGAKTQVVGIDLLCSAMTRDDFLVQPLLVNHPALAPLSLTGDALTVRLVTDQYGGRLRCSYAVLEIPADTGGAGSYHIILPVAPTSGEVHPFPGCQLPADAKAQHDAIIARIGRTPLPYWHQLQESAMAAHRLLPGLYAIAWDYIITPEGPIMLEGNSGWSLTTPQMIMGGLLNFTIAES